MTELESIASDLGQEEASKEESAIEKGKSSLRVILDDTVDTTLTTRESLESDATLNRMSGAMECWYAGNAFVLRGKTVVCKLVSGELTS